VDHGHWIYFGGSEHWDESDGAVGRVFAWPDVFALGFGGAFAASDELPEIA
jgi:hypothetical protein